MELRLRLVLPRDGLSIPVVRRILARAMDVLGVEPDDRADIELAITEACTNVLDHAGTDQEYEVSCGLEDEFCIIRVVDRGGGFDPAQVQLAGESDETGRGLVLMHALVDAVHFDQRSEDGTIVTLEKRLHFAAGSPAARLTDN